MLEQLCMTGVSWLKTLMRGAKENTIESLMAKVHNNKPLFEFMWVIRMLVVPYCHMRWLVRTGEHAEILKQMGYWFHLFAGCNKVRFPFFLNLIKKETLNYGNGTGEVCQTMYSICQDL